MVWTDRNYREIKRTFSSKCNGSHEFDFAFYYVFQPLLPNSCFPWPAKKKKNHIHVYIFIFTSGSSAFWGHPRCGLLIWLSLLAIFNALFWVYAIFCMSRRNKTQIIYLKAANILEGSILIGGMQCWVPRGVKWQVSIWCRAKGARRWMQISIVVCVVIYIYLFWCDDGLNNWLCNKTMACARAPSSLLLSASVTNSRVQIWNLSQSVNPT